MTQPTRGSDFSKVAVRALIIVFVAVLVCVVLGGAVIGGAVWWLSSNRERLAAEGASTMAEGRAFGRGKSSEACVTEALSRLPRVSGLLGEVHNKLFLKSCLETAARDPSLCTGVPPRDEIIDGATWTITTCAQRGHPQDQSCGRLLRAIQETCHPD